MEMVSAFLKALGMNFDLPQWLIWFFVATLSVIVIVCLTFVTHIIVKFVQGTRIERNWRRKSVFQRRRGVNFEDRLDELFAQAFS